ncbi:hypothetical protein QS257_09615 [Terrilactibacillus sp. S3-3]|nr:hypothetical protein QS257_09615 [Terrilactibacillus sp. S3-3]
MNQFEQAVKDYVNKTFKPPYFHTEPYGGLPHGIRVINQSNDECLVYWNNWKNDIDVVFTDKK